MRSLLTALMALLVATSCSNTTDPEPDGPTTGDLTVTRLSDLPNAGGDATSVAFVNASTLVAVIDGAIHDVPLGGGPTTRLHADARFLSVTVGGGGELYALSDDALWVIDRPGGTATKAPVTVRTPQTLKVVMTIGPDGRPYLRIHRYPSSMTLYTSADRGITWATVELPSGYTYGGGLAFGPGEERYLASPEGFFTSTDAGTSWQRFPAPLPGYGGELLRRKNGDILFYEPGGGGLRVSRNGGASFETVSPFNAYPFIVDMEETEDGTLYALIDQAGSTQSDRPMRLMTSTDGGTTWQHRYFAQGHDMDVDGNRIAVGHGTAGCGGVAVSTDRGATFTLRGTGAVGTISSFGFDADNRLLLLADRTLFRRAVSGWQCLGSNLGFTAMVTTPQGTIYLPSPTVTSSSTDGGVTWRTITMPDYVWPGVGSIAMPAMIGLQNGEALVSITTFRSDLVPNAHTNGMVVRLRPDGTAERTAGVAGCFVSFVQDASGTLHGRSENFTGFHQSVTNGAMWAEVAAGAPGFAYDSRDRFLGYGERNTFRYGKGPTTIGTLTLAGFTSESHYVTKALFDRSDIPHLLTMDKGLFIATTTLP